jgi:hypothetical protein
MGFARLFRPTYAGANMGHPSRFVWSLALFPALTPVLSSQNVLANRKRT